MLVSGGLQVSKIEVDVDLRPSSVGGGGTLSSTLDSSSSKIADDDGDAADSVALHSVNDSFPLMVTDASRFKPRFLSPEPDLIRFPPSLPALPGMKHDQRYICYVRTMFEHDSPAGFATVL